MEGETWIPFSDVKRIYKINLDELAILVEEEKVRFRTFLNPHNDKQFKGYSVIDLEEYLPKNGRVKVQVDVKKWF